MLRTTHVPNSRTSRCVICGRSRSGQVEGRCSGSNWKASRVRSEGLIEIRPEDYAAVRAEPRHFAVLPGHIYPDVERVVREADGYVVVEKQGTAAEVVEIFAPYQAPE